MASKIVVSQIPSRIKEVASTGSFLNPRDADRYRAAVISCFVGTHRGPLRSGNRSRRLALPLGSKNLASLVIDQCVWVHSLPAGLSVKPLKSRETRLTPEDSACEDRSSAVARLFREHNRMLVGFLFARLKNEQEAKEVAQEAYVKVLRLEEKPGAASFMRSYLFRVAENLAIDRLRQRQSRSRLDQLDVFDELLDDSGTERAVLAAQELALIEAAIAELPEKYRQAFRLVRLEDRSFPEVAAFMEISERMVRKYVTGTLIYIRLRREGVAGADAWNRLQS